MKYLFTLSGNQILSVYDATLGRDITLIHTRHEAAAVHMADAWGRLTGQPGVALLTAGPGHLNALSALYVALQAESPLVLLSGHCPRAQVGQGGFQEVDQIAAARPTTRTARLVEEAGTVADHLIRAFARAGSGRPGPVHLSLPVDVLEALVAKHAPPPPSSRPSSSGVADATIHATLDLLSASNRPLILAGPAMTRPPRWPAVEELADVSGIPALRMESPRGINDPALHAASGCLAEADVVLLLGKKLDFMLQFGQPPAFSPDCRFIQFDAESAWLRPGGRVKISARGDPLAVTRQLVPAARKRRWNRSEWRQRVDAALEFTPAEWDDFAASVGQPIHPLRVCRALQPYLTDGGVLVSDGGEFGQWMQGGLRVKVRLINGPSGAIGSGLPMALAAQLAFPDRRVFVTLGDGTFGYHAFELDTAVRYSLPVVAIIGNDARWNAEHQLQVRHYGPNRAVACDLLPSRYDKVVEALGGHAEFVEEPNQLEPALDRAVRSGKPACVNVRIEGAAAPVW